MNTILNTILETTIYASIMMIIIMGIRLLFAQKINTKVLSLIWILVLARFIIPVTIESPLHINEMFPQTKNISTQVVQDENQNTTSDVQVDNFDISPTFNKITNIQPPLQDNIEATKPIQATTVESSFFQDVWSAIKNISILTWITIVWAIGVLIIIMQSVVIGYIFADKIRGTKDDKDLANILQKANATVRVKRQVRIIQSRHVDVPVVYGIFKPTIVFPTRLYAKLDSQKLVLIIMHELSHIKRYDILLNMFWLIAKALHWFNPLVWIGFNAYLEDVELACDEKVVSGLSKKVSYLYSQSLLDVIKVANKYDKIPVALTFAKNKDKLKRRVESMLRPKRKIRAISTLAIVVAFVMTLGCFTTACIPSAEVTTEISSTQENEKIIDDIATEVSDTPMVEESEEAVNTDYDIISVNETLESNHDNIHITFDAEIKMPKEPDIQIVDVTNDRFTTDFVKTAAAVLFEGAPAYEPRTALTKSEIQTEIDELEFALANPQQSTSDGLREDDPSDTIKLFEDRIKIYEDLLADAPENIQRKEADFEFRPSKYYEEPAMYEENVLDWENSSGYSAKRLLDKYENDMWMILDSDMPNGYYGRINVSNYESDWMCWSRIGFMKNDVLNPNYYYPIRPKTEEELGDVGFTQQEAMNMANKLIENLGLNDMVLSNISVNTSAINYYDEEKDEIVLFPQDEITTYSYSFDYTRKLGTTPSAAYWIASFSSEDERPIFDNERLNISINQDGIYSFNYNNIVKVKNIQSDIEILPFEDCLESAKEYIVDYVPEQMRPEHTYDGKPDEHIEAGYVDITEIKLVMIRTPKEDESNTFQMVPAWQFIGNVFIDYDYYDIDIEDRLIYGNKSMIWVVNAVDGSMTPYAAYSF